MSRVLPRFAVQFYTPPRAAAPDALPIVYGPMAPPDPPPNPGKEAGATASTKSAWGSKDWSWNGKQWVEVGSDPVAVAQAKQPRKRAARKIQRPAKTRANARKSVARGGSGRVVAKKKRAGRSPISRQNRKAAKPIRRPRPNRPAAGGALRAIGSKVSVPSHDFF
jgi:hypothetical protein